MCNIKYYIKETEAYFAKTLGEDVALEPADKGLLEGLPISVSSNFSFYEGCLLRQSVLLAYIKDGDSVPPAQMKKLLDIIQRQTKLVVILITPCISSYNKVRLVAQKVNFVIPDKQIFAFGVHGEYSVFGGSSSLSCCRHLGVGRRYRLFR